MVQNDSFTAGLRETKKGWWYPWKEQQGGTPHLSLKGAQRWSWWRELERASGGGRRIQPACKGAGEGGARKNNIPGSLSSCPLLSFPRSNPVGRPSEGRPSNEARAGNLLVHREGGKGWMPDLSQSPKVNRYMFFKVGEAATPCRTIP